MENMVRIKNKKILVTGGTGFIGSHLVEELLNKGAKVTAVDINSDKKSYFFTQKLQNKATFIKLDITDKIKTLKFIAKTNPDYIYHLAAEAIVDNSFENPYRTFETNVMGTVTILEAARINTNIKGIIVASSDKAYGKTKKAYTEDSPLNGDHPYDVSKSSTDLISTTYYKTYKLPVVVTRFGNVYGEGDFHMNRIIPGICEAIITQKPLLIRSDGTYVRDYLYVKDVINGYILLLEKIESIKGEAFNFSSIDKFSVLALIKKIEKKLDITLQYKILNIAKNEIPYQHLNDRKIKKLGWRNKYSVSNTIEGILSWYKKII